MILRDWQKTAFPLIMEAWQRQENGILRAATGSGKSRLIALTAKHTKLGI
jgi:CRISPR/Cas system-associated endonuclease/helicase Cas3